MIAPGRLLLLVGLVALIASSVAAADPSDPRVLTTKVDQAHARTYMLKASDLGLGWAGLVQHDPSTKIPMCPTRPQNNSDLALTGHAESILSLDSAGISVDADVEVFRSTKQVDRLFKRVVAKGIEGCLKYDLLETVAATNARVGSVKALKLTPIGTHSADYRLTLLYNGKQIVNDYLFVSKGRVQFFVSVVAPGLNASLMLGIENRVARLLTNHAANA